mmetsp:Transcript_24171/g.60383  ORF Transcript_24171/g.60383 Transcript_24171/m.60383 type:complete len:238 (-) Transcript_24171:847-1560(-)
MPDPSSGPSLFADLALCAEQSLWRPRPVRHRAEARGGIWRCLVVKPSPERGRHASITPAVHARRPAHPQHDASSYWDASHWAWSHTGHESRGQRSARIRQDHRHTTPAQPAASGGLARSAVRRDSEGVAQNRTLPCPGSRHEQADGPSRAGKLHELPCLRAGPAAVRRRGSGGRHVSPNRCILWQHRRALCCVGAHWHHRPHQSRLGPSRGAVLPAPLSRRADAGRCLHRAPAADGN